MDANWIFGLLAILLLLEHLYKQVTGKSFHHSIPHPYSWILAFVSSVGAACSFALAWHTFTSREFLLIGPSSFWLLLGIILTGLSIVWLLPGEPSGGGDDSARRLSSDKQPLAARRSPAGQGGLDVEGNRRVGHRSPHRPMVIASSPSSPPRSSQHSSAFSPVPSHSYPLSPLFSHTEALPPSTKQAEVGANAKLSLKQTRQSPAQVGLAQSGSDALAQSVPQIFFIALVTFALLAVGWQLGHVFALSQGEASVALSLPLNRPTPTSTPITNVSLTERLMAQTSANVPVASETLLPPVTPTSQPVQRIAIVPISGRNDLLEAKPAFAGSGVGELGNIEFRRSQKSTLEASAIVPLTAAVPVGGATSRQADSEPQNPVVRLLEPVNGYITPDIVTLRWSADFELPQEQHYEVVAWLEGQEPFTQGISLAPLTSANQVRVNLALLDRALGSRFHAGIYRWGVMLVQRSPYQRIALLSNALTITYMPAK